MDYETVSKINPSLVYASITGYGQTGPYSNRAGYDVMVEAYGNNNPTRQTIADLDQGDGTDAHHRRKRRPSCQGRSRSD